MVLSTQVTTALHRITQHTAALHSIPKHLIACHCTTFLIAAQRITPQHCGPLHFTPPHTKAPWRFGIYCANDIFNENMKCAFGIEYEINIFKKLEMEFGIEYGINIYPKS